MIQKKVLNRERVRKVPQQFGFVDHRLVRDGHIDRLGSRASALYLFLVTVGDRAGLSYYGDQSIQKRLDLSDAELIEARNTLIQTGLIAYESPLYQVLDLEPHPIERNHGAGRGQGPIALGEILKRLTGGDR